MVPTFDGCCFFDFSGQQSKETCKCPSCLATSPPGFEAKPLSTASGMISTVWRKSLLVCARIPLADR